MKFVHDQEYPGKIGVNLEFATQTGDSERDLGLSPQVGHSGYPTWKSLSLEFRELA